MKMICCSGGDRDQLVAMSGTVITMIPECFPQEWSSAGHHRRQAVLRRQLRERQRANQEIVHA